MNPLRTRIAIGTLVGTAMLLAACSVPSIDELLAEARKDQQNGDLAGAAIHLKNVLSQNPQHAEARYLLGLLFIRNGAPHSAEQQFRGALEAKYDARVVLPLLAQSLFEQAAFEKLLEATRSSDFGEAALQPEVLALRGHSQLSLRQTNEAATSFILALKLKPGYVLALLGQARLATEKGDLRAAADLVETVLAADPASLDAWLMKGDLVRAGGKFDDALAAYQKALALNPRGLAANLNLASMHMAAGKLDLARGNVDIVREVAPEMAIGYYLQGLLEFRSRNFAAANEAVREVLKAAPDYLPANALSGVLAYSLGSLEQAEKRLGDALSRDPGSVYLRKFLAATLLKSRKVRLAIEVLEPALKSAPNDPVVLALAAEASFDSNDMPRARKYFELAAKQKPQDPRIRTGLGLTRMAAGDSDRALADLEAAVDLGGGAAEVFLVTSLVSAKQVDRALEAVTRLEEKRPNDPVTFNLKGAVLMSRGDVAGARKAFEQAVQLKPAQFAAAVNLAQLDFRGNDAAAARKRFETILASDKDNAPAMLALADLATATGNRDQAMAWIERAKQAQPNSFAPSMALTRQYFSVGDYGNAVAAAADALKAEPENAQALNMLGYSQLRLGKNSDALLTYVRLASRYPKSAEALYGLSSAQSANGSFAAAQLSLRRALGLRPKFPEAIYALAALQLRSGKIADARKLVGDAQKLLPGSAVGLVIAGDAAMAEKRNEQAVRAYEAAFAMDRTDAILMKLHGALRAAGKTAAADALAADWLAKHPDDVPMRYFVADAAIRGENFPLAAEQYEYALRKQPDKLALLHNLGWVYERMKDPRALKLAEKAYEIAPTSPGVMHDLGRLLIESGNAQRAVKLLEQARVLAPEAQLIRYQLAKGYAMTGDNAAARLELEQLLRGQSEFAGRTEAAELLKKLRN